MNSRYLEITYRSGKPLAAYFYLPRSPGDTVARTKEIEPGLLTDFTADGRPIGIEITSPRSLTADGLNRVLAGLGQPPATADDLRPLSAAA